MESINIRVGMMEFPEKNIAEIIPSDGIEIQKPDIIEMDEIAFERFQETYTQLINRKNEYSHTEESMMAVAGLKHVCAFAILVYNQTSKTIAEMQVQLQTLFGNKMKIFSDREEAIEWLKEELAQQRR